MTMISNNIKVGDLVKWNYNHLPGLLLVLEEPLPNLLPHQRCYTVFYFDSSPEGRVHIIRNARLEEMKGINK